MGQSYCKVIAVALTYVLVFELVQSHQVVLVEMEKELVLYGCHELVIYQHKAMALLSDNVKEKIIKRLRDRANISYIKRHYSKYSDLFSSQS